MVLPFQRRRGVVVVEFAVTLAPIDQIAVEWRLIPFDIYEFIFGVRNYWKRLV